MDLVPIQIKNRGRVLICVFSAVILVAFGVLIGVARPMPTQPTTWVIQVIAPNDSTETVTYSVSASPDAAHRGCSDAKPPYIGTNTNGDISMCAHDTVQWQGVSVGNHHELVVFVSDNILNTTTFRGKDHGLSLPAGTLNVSPPPSIPTNHEYYVVLWDKDHNQVHHGDPKIIIGSGSYE